MQILFLLFFSVSVKQIRLTVQTQQFTHKERFVFPIDIAEICPFFAISPTYPPLPTPTHLYMQAVSIGRVVVQMLPAFSPFHIPWALAHQFSMKTERTHVELGGGETDQVISGNLVLLCWAIIPLSYLLMVGICISFLLLPL